MSTPSNARASAFPYLLILAVAAACFAVNSQSLWMDEAETAIIVLPSTLRGCWEALYKDHTSCLQMPVYFAYLWGWSRLFGTSELLLRASNLPWFFVGCFSIVHFLRRHPALRNAALLLFCIHPFVLYYLNEVRSYAMDLAGAMLVTGALFDAMDRQDETLPASWWWCVGAGIFLLCGATVIGVPWAFAITLLLVARPNVRRSLSTAIVPALVFLPLLILLGLYFAWTFKEKFRNASLPTSLASMLSVFYELFGFLGLGPGRNDLRANSLAATPPYFAPLAVLGVPLAYGLLLALRRRFDLSRAHFISILLVTGLLTGFTFALGFLRNSRMLARHFTPLFPFVLMAEAVAILLLWKGGRPLGRIAAALIVIALACSSIETRFAARHAKDDIRSAADAARQALAQGKIVWWAASPEGARYYQLPIAARDFPGAVRGLYGLPLSFTAPPDEIVISKPDIFDPAGTLTAFIASHHYAPAAQWQSFTLWQKPN